VPVFRRGAEAQGNTPGGEQQRFPGYDVLGQVENWDAVTAGVVLERLALPPALRFFSIEEQAVGTCLFDQLLDQRGEPKVPILELVDARLAENETDGWHYEDMPTDGEAFRRTFAALDDDARSAYGRHLFELDWVDQTDVIQAMQDVGDGDWHGLVASRVWSLWTRYACTAFYSHPWAWNEIGFGGPAYPRGYKNIGLDRREPWEVADRMNRSPTGTGDRIEEARRRHTEVRRRQLGREGSLSKSPSKGSASQKPASGESR
jgi:gluconate 2-dehydrogenase subunit 3-like protein